jgi:hypothetical protein
MEVVLDELILEEPTFHLPVQLKDLSPPAFVTISYLPFS